MAKLPSEDIQIRTGYLFPDMENYPTSKKETYEYAIQLIKAAYSHYSNNQGDIPYSGNNGQTIDDYVDSLRQIAAGTQSPALYKDYFYSDDTSEFRNLTDDKDTTLDAAYKASRKGWFTGIVDVTSFIPALMRKVKSEFLRYDTDIKAFCVDADATSRELLRMNKEWVRSSPKTRPIMNVLRRTAKLPPKEPLTDSYEALEDMRLEGTFKDQQAKAAEQAIQHTEDISDWKLSLKEKLFSDIFINRSAFAWADYNETTCKVEWEYVDVKNFGCTFSFEKDYKDVQLIYRFKYVPLNKIRELQDKITNGVKTGLNAEDFATIAGKYKDYSDNKNSVWYRSGARYNANAMDFTVLIMEMRVLDVLKDKELEYVKRGTRVPYREGYEKNKNYSVIENRRLMRYDCSWIVGTDYIWNYGWAKNQAYIGSVPALGFAGFKTMEKSPIESLIPIAHLYAISWMTFSNKLLKSLPDFIAVNKSKMGRFKNTDDDLYAIKMLRQELVYIYESDEANGGDGVPIKKIDGTKYKDIMEELNYMEGLLRQAEILTGISAMSYGVTPDPKLPVRNALASMNSSNTAVGYLMNGVMVIKNRLSEQTIPMIANIVDIEQKAYDNYAKVIGEDDVRALKENREGMGSLGLKMYPRPTDEMKDQLIEAMKVEMARGFIDSVMVAKMTYQLYRGGNFLEVLHKLEYEVKKEKERQTKEKKMLVQEQAKGNEQAGMRVEQMKAKVQQEQMASDRNLAYAKGQVQTIVDDNKAVNDFKKAIVDKMTERGEDPAPFIADIQSLVEQRRSQLSA